MATQEEVRALVSVATTHADHEEVTRAVSSLDSLTLWGLANVGGEIWRYNIVEAELNRRGFCSDDSVDYIKRKEAKHDPS